MATAIAAAALSTTATTAQVAALASTITTGFQIAGTAFSVISSISAGNAEADRIEAAAHNNSEQLRLDAALTNANSEEQNLQDMKQLKLVLASQDASGRSDALMEDSLAEAAKTFDIRRFSSSTEASRLLNQSRAELSMGKSEAGAARTKGYTRAGGSLFDLASGISNRRSTRGTIPKTGSKLKIVGLGGR
jgi:hypothetical protein